MFVPADRSAHIRRLLAGREYAAAVAELAAWLAEARAGRAAPELVARLANRLAAWQTLRAAWTTRGAGAPARVARHLTVRYYRRIRPAKLSPILVVLSPRPLRAEELDASARQTEPTPLGVGYGEPVEVEAVVPGCTCYPPKLALTPAAGPVVGRFEVSAPHRGPVANARLVVSQGGRVLTEVPLDIRARSGIPMLVNMAAVGLLPAALKGLGLDAESAARAGFSPWEHAARSFAAWAGGLSWGVAAAAGAAGVAAVARLWRARPSTFDAIAEVAEAAPASDPGEQFRLVQEALAAADERAALDLSHGLLVAHPEFQPGWLAVGEWLYDRRREADALPYLAQALELGPVPAGAVGKAARSAASAGQTELAIDWLERAAAGADPGVRWKLFFNLACYRARLGRVGPAMDAVREAARDPGVFDPAPFRTDADLAPLRGRDDFRQILGLPHQ